MVHVFDFAFRPFWGGWIQPFAWFGTKGAAPATILIELVVKAISALYDNGTVVKTSVTDGCSTNKGVLKQFGITWTKDSKCSIEHPIDQDIIIHFFIDVPHVIKCTRNHLLAHKVMSCNKFKPYRLPRIISCLVPRTHGGIQIIRVSIL